MDDKVGSLRVTAREGALRFSVRVKPRASREGVGGVREGALEVSVSAPPVEGQANEAVLRTLAAALGVPRREVSLVAGDASRQKVVEVRGLEETALRAKLRLG
jgi:uncharacterized protein (TIGR00251 family)